MNNYFKHNDNVFTIERVVIIDLRTRCRYLLGLNIFPAVFVRNVNPSLCSVRRNKDSSSIILIENECVFETEEEAEHYLITHDAELMEKYDTIVNDGNRKIIASL